VVVEILLSYQSTLTKISNGGSYNRYTINSEKDYRTYIEFIERLMYEKKYWSYKYKLNFFTSRMNNVFNKNSKILKIIDKLYNDILIENGYVIYDTDSKKILLFWDAIHQTLFLENEYTINLSFDIKYQGVLRYKSILGNADKTECKGMLKKLNQSVRHTQLISLKKISVLPFNIYDEELQEYFKELEIYQVYFPVQSICEVIDSMKNVNLDRKYKYDDEYIYLKSDVPIKFEQIYQIFDIIARHEINDIQMILVEDKKFNNNKEINQLNNVYYIMTEENATLLYRGEPNYALK